MTKTTKLKLTDMEISEALGIVRASGRLGPETTISLIDDVKALRILVSDLDKGLTEIENMDEIELMEVSTPFVRDLRYLVPDSLKANNKGEINERTT